MPNAASRATPLIAAALMATWIAQLPPRPSGSRAAPELAAVAHIWTAIHCGNPAGTTRAIIPVNVEDLLRSAAHFEAIRAQNGLASACAKARQVAGLGNKTSEQQPLTAILISLQLP